MSKEQWEQTGWMHGRVGSAPGPKVEKEGKIRLLRGQRMTLTSLSRW